MTGKNDIEQEISETLGETSRYDLQTMFPERDGFLAHRRIKKKLKLLKNLMPALSTTLLDGEKVLYAAQGYVMYWWEQIFAGGVVAYYANITCLVLTDRRIIFVNSSSAGQQKHFRNQALYTEIQNVQMRSFLSSASKLKFKDGKTLAIGGFKGGDRKYLQQYIPELVSAMPKEAPRVERSIQYLCPHCPAIYAKLTDACGNCGTRFKSPKKAALMSLCLPGLGDLYLGHRFFGTLELIGSIIAWLFLLAAIISVAKGEKDSLSALVGWVIIVGLANLVDYFITLAMGRKGLIAMSHAPVAPNAPQAGK
jgi:hypothetical protein